MPVFRSLSNKLSKSNNTTNTDEHKIWHNVGIPAPTTTVEDAILAARHGNDIYEQTSTGAAELPTQYQTIDPNSTNNIHNRMPKSPFTPLQIPPRPNYESHPILSPALERCAPTGWTSVSGTNSGWSGFQSEGKSSTSKSRAYAEDPMGCDGRCQRQPIYDQNRTRSDAGCTPAPRVQTPTRSRSEVDYHHQQQAASQRAREDSLCEGTAGAAFDLSRPWNPTAPPYSKYYANEPRGTWADEDDKSGVSRPVKHEGGNVRLSELIDPADLVPARQNRFGSFDSVSSPSYGGSVSSGHRSRGTSPASSASHSREGSRKPSLADSSSRTLPPVLESPSGKLFSTSEFAAHPNRPLAIRERQEHIRAAIENLERESRELRNASRKGSTDSNAPDWKTGFGSDSRKGSATSAAYGGFGVDRRPSEDILLSIERLKIEEVKRAYEDKYAKQEERKGSVFGKSGRKGSLPGERRDTRKGSVFNLSSRHRKGSAASIRSSYAKYRKPSVFGDKKIGAAQASQKRKGSAWGDSLCTFS